MMSISLRTGYSILQNNWTNTRETIPAWIVFNVNTLSNSSLNNENQIGTFWEKKNINGEWSIQSRTPDYFFFVFLRKHKRLVILWSKNT